MDEAIFHYCSLHIGINTLTRLVARRASALVVRARQLVVEREVVRRLEDIRRIARTKDVALLALPLGLVDGIDPVLDLHDDAAILLDGAWTIGDVAETLGFLEGEGACKM